MKRNKELEQMIADIEEQIDACKLILPLMYADNHIFKDRTGIDLYDFHSIQMFTQSLYKEKDTLIRALNCH